MNNNQLKPLRVGNLTFPTNLIQGPLAGISCAPFRLLTWRYSEPAFSCTEMISCKTIIHQPRLALERYIKKDPAEGPVCFQLSTDNPLELAEATKRVTDYGANLIDLNCGCPVKKIRSKGAGSSLLTNSAKLYQLMCAMKQNTHVPVSIKIRVEGGSNDKFNAEIVKIVKEAGIDFLVVHGRHWTEHYETPCNYDEIKFFVSELSIPVIGNGDVACFNSLEKILATGCAGAMIGRAGVGQPWLIKKLTAEMNATPFIPPKPDEIRSVLIEHVERLTTLLDNEKFAIMQARTFAKYYARGFPSKMEFNLAMNECHTLEDLKTISAIYFK